MAENAKIKAAIGELLEAQMSLNNPPTPAVNAQPESFLSSGDVYAAKAFMHINNALEFLFSEVGIPINFGKLKGGE